jgi:hypothetical protein
MVSLETFIDIILPAALWSWIDSASNRNVYQGCILGVKVAGAWGRNLTSFMCRIVLKSGSLIPLETSGPVQGTALPLPLPC